MLSAEEARARINPVVLTLKQIEQDILRASALASYSVTARIYDDVAEGVMHVLKEKGYDLSYNRAYMTLSISWKE